MRFEWPSADEADGWNQDGWSFEFPIASRAKKPAEPVKPDEAAGPEEPAEPGTVGTDAAGTDAAAASDVLSPDGKDAASVPLPGRRDAVDGKWAVPDVTVGHPPVFGVGDRSDAVSVAPQQIDHQDHGSPDARRRFSSLFHRGHSNSARSDNDSDVDERSA